MKSFTIPVTVLAVVLSLILLSAHCLTRLGDGWQEAADALSSAALAGDMVQAQQSLDTLEQRWQRHSLYLELVLSHTSLDEVDVLLHRARVQCHTGDSAGLAASAAELGAKLALLVDSQQVRWGNIW